MSSFPKTISTQHSSYGSEDFSPYVPSNMGGESGEPIFHHGNSSISSNSSCSIDFNRHLESIRKCIYMLLLEFPSGIDSAKLPLLLYVRLRCNFDCTMFGCATINEFLQKFISPYYDLEFIPINSYDFILRLKGMNYEESTYYNPFTQPAPYPIHFRFETDPEANQNFRQACHIQPNRSVDISAKLSKTATNITKSRFLHMPTESDIEGKKAEHEKGHEKDVPLVMSILGGCTFESE